MENLALEAAIYQLFEPFFWPIANMLISKQQVNERITPLISGYTSKVDFGNSDSGPLRPCLVIRPTDCLAMIIIDGSVLEGGGQIVRTTCSLSNIISIPVSIKNIRANRSKPGLAAQHLTGLKLVARISGMSLEGGHIGSRDIRINPRAISSQGNY